MRGGCGEAVPPSTPAVADVGPRERPDRVKRGPAGSPSGAPRAHGPSGCRTAECRSSNSPAGGFSPESLQRLHPFGRRAEPADPFLAVIGPKRALRGAVTEVRAADIRAGRRALRTHESAEMCAGRARAGRSDPRATPRPSGGGRMRGTGRRRRPRPHAGGRRAPSARGVLDGSGRGAAVGRPSSTVDDASRRLNLSPANGYNRASRLPCRDDGVRWPSCSSTSSRPT